MVGEAGIEPALPFGKQILSLSCLPISPLARGMQAAGGGDPGGGTIAQRAAKAQLLSCVDAGFSCIFLLYRAVLGESGRYPDSFYSGLAGQFFLPFLEPL